MGTCSAARDQIRHKMGERHNKSLAGSWKTGCNKSGLGKTTALFVSVRMPVAFNVLSYQNFPRESAAAPYILLTYYPHHWSAEFAPSRFNKPRAVIDVGFSRTPEFSHSATHISPSASKRLTTMKVTAFSPTEILIKNCPPSLSTLPLARSLQSQ